MNAEYRRNSMSHGRLSWRSVAVWSYLCLSCLLIPVNGHGEQVASGASAQIAIIIDDLGYRRAEGFESIELPGAVTLAVLPHTPYALAMADRANDAGKEIILHLPMESNRGLKLGPGGLTVNMSKTRFESELMRNIDAVPHIIGISNHMGSRLGSMREPLAWMMTLLHSRHRPLFFVDSRTSSDSLIAEVASANGVPSITRDVFLDHDSSIQKIRSQFHLLVAIARQRGTALAIGHPYPQTLSVLTQELQNIGSYGVELVPVSQLLRRRLNRLETATLPRAGTNPAGRKPTT